MEESTQVSNPVAGVGTPTNPGRGRDVGAQADDLDARMNARIEQAANGFRSIMDRRVGQLERTNQQLTQQLTHTQQQLGQITQYFQRAQESELEPEERQRREDMRTQQAWSTERAGLILNARKQAAAFRVLNGIQSMGFVWNDDRFDWAPDQYESDPDGWAGTVLMNANRRFASDVQANQTAQRTANQTAQQRFSQETQAQQQVQDRNAERQTQAAAVSTAVPSGVESNWMDKVKQMSHKERLEYIERTNRGILHGEITHPSQTR
jgi:hypothetical protein